MNYANFRPSGHQKNEPKLSRRPANRSLGANGSLGEGGGKEESPRSTSQGGANPAKLAILPIKPAKPAFAKVTGNLKLKLVLRIRET